MTEYKYTGLLNYCNSLTEFTINNFKQNGNIIDIIENVSYEFGKQWLDKININLTPEIILSILQVDHIGTPKKYQFNINDNSLLLSPTTVRFIAISLDILQHIKNLNKSIINITEIGGGYGAQLVFLSLLAPLFNITITSYTILDIPQVNHLQNLYLQKSKNYVKLPVYSCITLERYTDKPDNFVISNYALGEFNKSWQDRYINSVVKDIDHGYLIWNFSPETPNIHEYFNTKNISIRDEDPQGNCYPIKTKIITY